jgi:hypothetical protein
MGAQAHDLLNSQDSEKSLLERIRNFIVSIYTYSDEPPEYDSFLSLIHEKQLSAKLDPRLFAHIHGDAFIAGTSLEGSNVEKMTNFLTLYAPNLPEKIHAVITGITQNMHFIPPDVTAETFGAEIAIKVKNLSIGESLWIDGGWSSGGNAGGHAMLYEFVKTSDDTYDIMIYNTGSGIEYHSIEIDKSSSIDADTPQLKSLHPVSSFRGLSSKHLGLNLETVDPSLFVKLIKLQKTEFGDEANAKKIYEEIFGPFNDYRENNPKRNNPHFFSMLPQQSGTCSFKAVDASVRKKNNRTSRS